jgi:hypothetical protein|nr:MAG TPA: Regulatory protein-modification, helix-turn-helix, transcriptional regulator, DNA [Caudoviricetes sp.]
MKKNNNKISDYFRKKLDDRIEELKIKPAELSLISGVPAPLIYSFRFEINLSLKFDYVVMLANALNIDLNEMKGAC